jgi:hypothetical protein
MGSNQLSKKRQSLTGVHCVNMRVRQVKESSEYSQSKSQSFAPSTRHSAETSLLDSPNESLPELDVDEDFEEDREEDELQSLQTVAQFLSESRENFQNISQEMIDAAPSTNKILIDNLPPRLTSEEFQKIFRRLDGGPLFYHQYSSRLFEVGQEMLPSDISNINKGVNKWSQVQKVL